MSKPGFIVMAAYTLYWFFVALSVVLSFIISEKSKEITRLRNANSDLRVKNLRLTRREKVNPVRVNLEAMTANIYKQRVLNVEALRKREAEQYSRSISEAQSRISQLEKQRRLLAEIVTDLRKKVVAYEAWWL